MKMNLTYVINIDLSNKKVEIQVNERVPDISEGSPKTITMYMRDRHIALETGTSSLKIPMSNILYIMEKYK